MKKIIIIGCILLVLFVTNFFSKEKEVIEEVEQSDIISEETITNDLDTIVFHIKGAVKNPGVYSIAYGSYLNQAIELAGGLVNANTDCLNLAQVVIPYQEIIIPSKEEGCSVDDSSGDLININTASVNELTTLSGIGESKANAIVEYRKNKPFVKIEDIVNVEGISNNLFNKIKDKITV